MAVSDVSICNRALNKMGAGKIVSLSDENEKARVLNTAYDPVRRAELRRRRWRFSIKRVSLPALADAPDSDFAHQYQLPSDYLRLIEGGDILSLTDLSDYRTSSSEAYSVEGRKILTNFGAPLHIRYIRDVTDASLFDSAFVESFASRLAYECCERITESDSKNAALLQDYRLSIREAALANALEVASASVGDGEWVVARTQ
ncbi:MAG: hypothetical protein V4457_05915 [Pseudomonadota bacterium]